MEAKKILKEMLNNYNDEIIVDDSDMKILPYIKQNYNCPCCESSDVSVIFTISTNFIFIISYLSVHCL